VWDADPGKLDEVKPRLEADKDEAKEDGILLSEDFVVCSGEEVCF